MTNPRPPRPLARSATWFVPLLLAALARPAAAGAPGRIAWQERFTEPALDWIDAVDRSGADIPRVYTLVHQGELSFLHARHDRSINPKPPAVHYGKAFVADPVPLQRVRALRWKWRALQHPSVTSDPWVDLAVSVYVLFRRPSFLHAGRGFKFGWLAKDGKPAHQRGLLEIPLRTEPATREWKSESVDLCALYTQEYGARCEGETVQYIGVLTDADNTRSIAEGDYADFELEVSP